MASLVDHNLPLGYPLATAVEVTAGESWFSPQMALPPEFTGVSFEVRVEPQTGDVPAGAFVPRGGNRLRAEGVSRVITTPTVLDDNCLPVIPGIDANDLPVIDDDEVFTLINLGNFNTNFVELELKITSGTVLLTVVASASR